MQQAGRSTSPPKSCSGYLTAGADAEAAAAAMYMCEDTAGMSLKKFHQKFSFV
jgi:hypothetical protein